MSILNNIRLQSHSYAVQGIGISEAGKVFFLRSLLSALSFFKISPLAADQQNCSSFRRLVILVLTLTTPVYATTAQPLTMPEQILKADIVLYGKISKVSLVAENGNTFSQYEFETTEPLKGELKNNLFTFKVLSNMRPEIVLPENSELIVFLYRQTGLYSPFVGYNQGIYKVTSGMVSSLFYPAQALPQNQLADFKKLVRGEK